MSTIILDFGSGNSCKNDKKYIEKMYNELRKIDTKKHKVIVKWQLFEEAGENIPLTHESFDFAYKYGNELGYEVTSSVFDKESLDFLLQFDIPFIKIANNRDLDYLIGEIPRKIPVIISLGEKDEPDCWQGIDDFLKPFDDPLYCISSYPSTIESYEKAFSANQLRRGISDHTTNFGLWYRYQPELIEWHYVLEHDENNLDGGLFARTPMALKEIL